MEFCGNGRNVGDGVKKKLEWRKGIRLALEGF